MFKSKLFRSSVTKIVSARSCEPGFISSQKISSFSENVVNLAYTRYESHHCDNSLTPVIILHGFLASRNSWSSVSEAIRQITVRTVISVDARNHGHSPHTTKCLYTHMTHDIMNLMRKLELSKVALLGHSMGGRTAMVMSLLYPQQVSSFISVDISPVSIPDHLVSFYPRLLDFLTTLDFEGITNVEEGTRFLKEKLQTFGITQSDMVNFISRNVVIKPDNMVGWICDMQTLKESFPELLKFPNIPEKIYPGPNLFIGAGLTDFIPPEDMQGIKRLFPRAQLKYVPGVRHNVHEENPSRFIRMATEFFFKHS